MSGWERRHFIIGGLIFFFMTLISLAIRLHCAEACAQRGGQGVWSTSGEFMCIEAPPRER